MANISGAERGAIFASVPTRVSARHLVEVSLTPGQGPRERSSAAREPEVLMLIPYDPLEHLPNPDKRFKILVHTRGAKIYV